MCGRNVRETVSLISRQNILCAFKIPPRGIRTAQLPFKNEIFYNPVSLLSGVHIRTGTLELKFVWDYNYIISPHIYIYT